MTSNIEIPFVYLAGPITGLSFGDCTDWREFSIRDLAEYGVPARSPMRGKDYLKGLESIKDAYNIDTDAIMNALSGDRGTITRDRNDVRTSGVVLANLLGAKSVSIGTVVELAWADIFRKPVVTVMEKTGNPHEHGFVRELSGYRVERLEDGLLIARALLLADPGKRAVYDGEQPA